METPLNPLRPPTSSNGSAPARLKQAVTDALEDSRYEWRTLEGIAQQTQLPLAQIREILGYLENEIVRSSVPDETGRDLYTTRRHYKKTHGLGSRILTALSDKVA